MQLGEMPVGERIKLYRRRRGLSQPKFAQLIGRSESWLSQVERGIRSVDRLSVIIELARVLKVQPVDLTGKPLSLAPNGGAHFEAVEDLRKALMSYGAIPAALGVTGDGERAATPARPSCCPARLPRRRPPPASCAARTARPRSSSWPRSTTSPPSR